MICSSGLIFALPNYLAVNKPYGYGYLIVEGWVSKASLRSAAEVFRHGNYQALVVSGGPIEDSFCLDGFKSFASRSAAELQKLGIAESKLIVAPAPATTWDRTYVSALAVKQTFTDLHLTIETIDLLSSGPHTRRSFNLYRKAFGDQVSIGTIATAPSDYELSSWWKSSVGVKDFIAETAAYSWTACCFHPDK
jgi:hypothetical protein